MWLLVQELVSSIADCPYYLATLGSNLSGTVFSLAPIKALYARNLCHCGLLAQELVSSISSLATLGSNLRGTVFSLAPIKDLE